MKRYGIFWIESNDYKVLKSTHKTLELMSLFFSFIKFEFRLLSKQHNLVQKIFKTLYSSITCWV
jgi:hypothetical protein